ncbi:MAG: hypothetical protein ACTSRS_22180 [Candidatus Helarchaeota archaeon]
MAQNLLLRGHSVYGVDAFYRRMNVKKRGLESIIPIASPKKREEALKKLGNFQFESFDIATWYEGLAKVFRKFKPEAIINLAQLPSAPFSMISPRHANWNITNNVCGLMNILWCMREYTPESHVVTLGCYDEKTEVLTDNGWKFFKDLQYTDKVCSLNPDSEEIIFTNPTNIVKYRYKGKMLEIKTKQFDFLITPNHKIVFKRRRHNKNKASSIEIERADILERNPIHYIIPRGGKWRGTDSQYFILPSMKVRTFWGHYKVAKQRRYDMKKWLNFFGWHLSEGCVRYRKGEPTEIKLSQKFNSKYIDDLRKAIMDLKLNAVESLKKDGTVEFSIADNHLAKYLSQFGKAHEKFIPKHIKCLSSDYLEILLDSLMKGDGSWSKDKGTKGGGMFISNSKKLIDDFQEICLKTGRACVIGVDKRRSRPCYWASFSKRINNLVAKNRRKWIDYDGWVYCCTVPTHIIMVRRNGKMGWSGNTMGEYSAPNMNIPEGFFRVEYEGMTDILPFPRQPGSIYHTSKVMASDLAWFAARIWELRITDCMQGVVLGTRTDTMAKPELRTRFDIGECHGTMVNRAVACAVMGHPIVPYGSGFQKRAYIQLRDSIDCLTLLAENHPTNDDSIHGYRVVNQFDENYTCNEIAELVKEVGESEFGLEVEIKHIPNPRVEPEFHYYNPKHEKLYKMGWRPKVTIREALIEMFEDLLPLKERLKKFEDKIIPKIKWRPDHVAVKRRKS